MLLIWNKRNIVLNSHDSIYSKIKKTILLFLYLSLIFSISTCRIVPRPKGMRFYACITWKHIKKIFIDESYSCILFFYAINYTRELRPRGLTYLPRFKTGGNMTGKPPSLLFMIVSRISSWVFIGSV